MTDLNDWLDPDAVSDEAVNAELQSMGVDVAALTQRSKEFLASIGEQLVEIWVGTKAWECIREDIEAEVQGLAIRVVSTLPPWVILPMARCRLCVTTSMPHGCINGLVPAARLRND